MGTSQIKEQEKQTKNVFVQQARHCGFFWTLTLFNKIILVHIPAPMHIHTTKISNTVGCQTYKKRKFTRRDEWK